ncbi:MAG: dockerin type I domain-containing protein [Planctomycetota bacterium]
MKKVMVLAVVLLAVPAMAAVNLSCEVAATGGGNGTLTIDYDANTEVELVRAFALDVQVSGAIMVSIVSTNENFWVYPGTIVIDANGNIPPGGEGTPVAPANDPGALGDLPGTACTLEMGSLYEAGDANLTPDASGELIVIALGSMAASGSVEVTVNDTRAKIVMEDSVSVDANCICAWQEEEPNCWDPNHCPGQPIGDATCDGTINALDLMKAKLSWLKSKGQVGYNCCADFNHDNTVNALDVMRIKLNWLKTGLGGDGTQNCP